MDATRSCLLQTYNQLTAILTIKPKPEPRSPRNYPITTYLPTLELLLGQIPRPSISALHLLYLQPQQYTGGKGPFNPRDARRYFTLPLTYSLHSYSLAYITHDLSFLPESNPHLRFIVQDYKPKSRPTTNLQFYPLQ